MTFVQLTDLESSEEGFTLIQLVVVVAIIGILMAVGIPAFGAIVKETRRTAYTVEAQKVADKIVMRFYEEGGTLSGDSWDGAQSNNLLLQRIGREVVHEMDPEFESRAWNEPPASGHWVSLQGIADLGEWPAWKIGPQVQVYDLEGGVVYQYGGSSYYSGYLE